MAAPSESAVSAPPPGPGVESWRERLTPQIIDASCRVPVLLFFLSATVWLVIGSALAMMGSIKLHAPDFLAQSAWLTVGRVRPAAMNCWLYGFASQAGLGWLVWLACRLAGTRLRFPTTLLIAGCFWNLGVTLGVLSILAGESTGFEWLEMPRYAALLLFAAYAAIGICAALIFQERRERSLYVSAWYLLAALFWFPWIYSAANLLLLFFPVRGVMQSVVNAWYTSNFSHLWLSPLGLAALFYFIPKLLRRPLHSQSLAAFGFWSLVFLGPGTGLAQLVAGPVPRWMYALGVAANTAMLVPLSSVAWNLHLTLAGRYRQAMASLPLRFMCLGLACYVVAGLGSIILGTERVAVLTQFTLCGTACTLLNVLGFATFTLSGCLYYVLPRLTQVEWPCATSGRIHFWCSAVGVAVLTLSLAVGGLLQGFRLANPAIDPIQVARGTAPFLGMATLGVTLLLAGQAAFAVNVSLLLRGYCAAFCKPAGTSWLGLGSAKAEAES